MRYAYIAGNPLTNVDPVGLYCFSEAQINSIAGAAGGTVAGGAALAYLGPLGIAVGAQTLFSSISEVWAWPMLMNQCSFRHSSRNLRLKADVELHFVGHQPYT